jgi:hypothetical protein
MDTDVDPLDDPGYQDFLAETAKHCRSKYAPCPGCCAGGMCDGFLERDEDDKYDEDIDAE